MKRRRVRSKKDRLLAAWRGVWEPEDLSNYSRPVGEVMETAMQGLGLDRRLDQEAMVEAWAEVVGSNIANNARPIEVRRKVLIVQVLQPSIHYVLAQQMKGAILAKMQERFGKENIRDIDFRIG
ncbi:MAG: DUF721 domain-containing protein [Verrucomicrobiales bacterium]|nr:DUF721 domain-containing protein [Verrucomicrobiales bacterium]